MRILLDECLPKRLKRDLVGHDARTVPEMGWASKKNGELLALAEAAFDVFLTVDRNLSFQQDVGRFKVTVVVLVAKGNRHSDLQPLIPDLLAVLVAVSPGQLIQNRCLTPGCTSGKHIAGTRPCISNTTTTVNSLPGLRTPTSVRWIHATPSRIRIARG